MSKRELGVAAFAILLGIGIRVYVACGLDGKSWNDAAIIGLMAMHELEGKFYPFYWGQTYMGSMESLSIAPFFALFGVSDRVLYLGLLLWYLLFAAAVFAIARRGGPKRRTLLTLTADEERVDRLPEIVAH